MTIAPEGAIWVSAGAGSMDPERLNRGAVHGPRALAAVRGGQA